MFIKTGIELDGGKRICPECGSLIGVRCQECLSCRVLGGYDKHGSWAKCNLFLNTEQTGPFQSNGIDWYAVNSVEKCLEVIQKNGIGILSVPNTSDGEAILTWLEKKLDVDIYFTLPDEIQERAGELEGEDHLGTEQSRVVNKRIVRLGQKKYALGAMKRRSK